MKGDHENQEYLQVIEKVQQSVSSVQAPEDLQNSREDIEVSDGSDEEPDSPKDMDAISFLTQTLEKRRK